MASGSTPMAHRSCQSRDSSTTQCSSQASAEHFQQCAEFLPLRNRGLGPLVMTVLPIPLARRAIATPCAAVQSTATLSAADQRDTSSTAVEAGAPRLNACSVWQHRAPGAAREA